MESNQEVNITHTSNSPFKNKDVVFFETFDIELADYIRRDIMNVYSYIRPWIFVYKLWHGVEQKDYYVISIMNEHNNSFDQATIDMIQLHIFNLNMNYNLRDLKKDGADIVWV